MNWSEGIAPSIVNDNVRAKMAREAEWRDDTSGLLVSGGVSTAYTLTTNQGFPSTPNDGQLIVFSPHVSNGAAATLSADAGTAFPLQSSPGNALGASALTALIPYQFKFRTASSAWILFGSGTAASANVASAVTPGAVTNAGLANMAAWTIKGNNTSGSAPPGDFTIDALTAKASPLVADEVPIWDAAGTAMKKATLTALATLVLAQAAAPTVQRFTSGSAATYTPTAGFARIRVRMCGGGGGGGAQQTNNGSVGTDTSFGSWTAIHGNGGIPAGSGGAGGSGGVDGTGTRIVRLPGGSGNGAINIGGNNFNSGGGGMGAANSFGGAGVGVPGSSGGAAVANTGAGGAGGSGASGAGSSGSGGGAGEYVEFWMTAAQVGASQTYTVGTGGNGGSAGGQAGGNGAAGIIIIEEFYI